MRSLSLPVVLALSTLAVACGDDPSRSDSDSSMGDLSAPDGADAMQSDAASDATPDATPDDAPGTDAQQDTLADLQDAELDAVEPPPEPHFELTCEAPPSGVGGEVVEGWLSEAATRAVGHPASAALQGVPMAITGASRLDVDGETRFEVQDRGVEWMFLTGAEVEGLGRGMLAMRLSQGDNHSGRNFTRFEMNGLHATWAQLQPGGHPAIVGDGNLATLATFDERPPPQAGHEQADWRWWYDQAWSLGTDGVGAVEMPSLLDVFVAADGTETLLHETDVRVLSAEQAWIYVPFRYPIEIETETLSAARLEQSPSFGIGGDFVDGTISVPALDYAGRPTALFGRGGELTATAEGALTSQSDFALTQAIDEAGLLVPAAIEIAPTEVHVDVEAGGYRVVGLHVREASFAGDAVLGEVAVESNGPDDLLKLPVVPFENRTTRLFDVLVDAGWGAPVLFVPVIIAAPFVIFADILDCLFFGNCGSGESVRLEPFLGWIDAGTVHPFEIYVAGAGEPGDSYQAKLTYIGKNYCAASVTLTVAIHASCDATAGAEPCLCPTGKENDGSACVDAGQDAP